MTWRWGIFATCAIMALSSLGACDADASSASPDPADTGTPDGTVPMDASRPDAGSPRSDADVPVRDADVNEPDAAPPHLDADMPDGSEGLDAQDAAPAEDSAVDAADAGLDAAPPDAEIDAATDLDCPGATTVVTPGEGCQLLPSERLVFVSTTRVMGNFGGPANADARCNEAAQAAQLAGTFHAWLSMGVTHAKDRVSHGPYKLIDGTFIATDLDELVGVGPAVAIALTEQNMVYDGMVWTGTEPDGTLGGETCGTWSSASASDIGMAGDTGYITEEWTMAAEPYCNSSLAFYCVQDDCPGIGHVDFESDVLHCGACGHACSDTQICVDGMCEAP